jgi:hypothetical protein
MRTIYQALVQYELVNGFIPLTSSYGGGNVGGWDNSVEGNFLSFLVEDGFLSVVPIDPVNNAAGQKMSSPPTGIPAYGYRYFCYPSGGSQGLSLGYRRASDNVFINFSTRYPIGQVQGTGNTFFRCGNHN